MGELQAPGAAWNWESREEPLSTDFICLARPNINIRSDKDKQAILFDLSENRCYDKFMASILLHIQNPFIVRFKFACKQPRYIHVFMTPYTI